MRTHNRNRAVLIIVAAELLLLGTANAIAQEETTTVTHFLDSNTDRVPLLTAFPTYPDRKSVV